jgi:hypothetical protein
MVGTLFRFGGFYDPIGYARRNQPMTLPEANPLPENAKVLDCGDAGRDGYTVLSRASRVTGERTLKHATPMFEGPELEDY